MADIERLYKALRAADAAGDVEAATALAAETRRAIDELRRDQRRSDIAMKNPGEYLPSSAQFQKNYGPLRGDGSNFAAGAGKAFYDIGRGVSQLTGNMTREEMDAVKERDAPLMSTKAGISGNIGGNVAVFAPTAFIPGANTYAGAGLIGAGSGALQPVGTDDSRLANMGFGAAGGLAGRYIGGKIGDWAAKPRGLADDAAGLATSEASASGGGSAAQAGVSGSVNLNVKNPGSQFGYVGDDVSAGLTRAQREVMERGRVLGMKLTPGQASGSKALQQLEAKLESQPMTSGPFNAIKENNARVLARETARAIGENADTVDSAVLDRAFNRLSNVFKDAGDDVARQIDPQQFLSTYSQIQDDLRGIVSGFGDHPLVDDLIKHAQNGTATGKQLQALTSKLGKAAYNQMTSQSGNRELGLGLYQLKDYVDDLLMQGMSPERTARFAAARTQYRNLMNITSRVGIVNPTTGNVSGRSLANLLQQKDKLGFLRGQNQSGMYDAARFAKAFAPIVGDSGTATRSPIQGVTEMALRIPYNIAARAYTSPFAVNVASKAGAVAAKTGDAARSAFGTAPFYAPYLGGPLGGVLVPQLLAE